MTDPADKPTEMYRWYREKVEEIYRAGQRRRRAEFWSGLSYAMVLFSLGSLLGYAVQRHATDQIVISALGTVAALVLYWLNWYRLNRIRPVDLSPVFDRPSSEEGGSSDV
jgi:hypothetical protein